MMMTFVATALFFGLAMAGISVGVMARGRGLKGPCKGGSSCSCGPSGKALPGANLVSHEVSGCKRTFHVPQSSPIKLPPR